MFLWADFSLFWVCSRLCVSLWQRWGLEWGEPGSEVGPRRRPLERGSVSKQPLSFSRDLRWTTGDVSTGKRVGPPRACYMYLTETQSVLCVCKQAKEGWFKLWKWNRVVFNSTSVNVHHTQEQSCVDWRLKRHKVWLDKWGQTKVKTDNQAGLTGSERPPEEL